MASRRRRLKGIRPKDISKSSEKLGHVGKDELLPLPKPFDEEPPFKELDPKAIAQYDTSLDDTLAVGVPKPATPEEEEDLIRWFLSGLEKLLSKENNWAFLQQLVLSLDNCVKCQTCIEACPIYLASGRNDIYRPTLRSEVFRRIAHEHTRFGGKTLAKLKGENIKLNATAVSRLLELAYRCTLCRRCAQTCPIGVDNGLIAHEIRKLFSMEMGLSPRELHEKGSVQQLTAGSSTGMNSEGAKDSVSFIDEEMSELAGRKIDTPWDKQGAEVLLLHNAGEFLAWPENPGAFALVLEAAGVSWTLSSELAAYDAVNYGVWYDDVQFARIAIKQMEAAKKLGVKKVIIGECGHAHKSLTVIADRLLPAELRIPRESSIVFLRDIVMSGRLKLDASRNDFPVTLHDPCNLVRLMGIVKPQREILQKICPRFREMTPHGVDNYCCGGGSGFAIMSRHNFKDWRLSIAGRMKLKQVLEAFADCPGPDIKKYVCAPCSNCKGQLRDLFQYYDVWEKAGILYGGLVELIANAMPELKGPFIKWEFR
jgi:Fe-S oxidoreductase